MDRWTLVEAKNKLFTDNPEDEPELIDLGIAKRQITMDISIADGDEGLSIILTPSDDTYYNEQVDQSDWNFSFTLPYQDGFTSAQLIERIAQVLGIKPDERVWQDGEYM